MTYFLVVIRRQVFDLLVARTNLRSPRFSSGSRDRRLLDRLATLLGPLPPSPQPARPRPAGLPLLRSARPSSKIDVPSSSRNRSAVWIDPPAQVLEAGYSLLMVQLDL
jgi:hypothetical protein